MISVSPKMQKEKGRRKRKASFTCLARLASRLRRSLRVLSGGREHARKAVGQPGRDRERAVGSAAACAGEAESAGGPTASLELAVQVEERDELRMCQTRMSISHGGAGSLSSREMTRDRP